MDRTTRTSATIIPPEVNIRWYLERMICAHLVEVRNLGDVDEVDDGKVLNLLRDAVQSLVHDHALRVPVMSEADNDDTVFLGFDGFVDVPARWKVREEIRHS